MNSIKMYEWNKKLKLIIVIVLLVPIVTLIFIMIENYYFSNKIVYIQENIRLGMYKSEIVAVLGNATDAGYITEDYNANTLPDSLILLKPINTSKNSYLIYNFGYDFFKKVDDLALTFDTLDVLIEIQSPHL